MNNLFNNLSKEAQEKLEAMKETLPVMEDEPEQESEPKNIEPPLVNVIRRVPSRPQEVAMDDVSKNTEETAKSVVRLVDKLSETSEEKSDDTQSEEPKQETPVVEQPKTESAKIIKKPDNQLTAPRVNTVRITEVQKPQFVKQEERVIPRKNNVRIVETTAKREAEHQFIPCELKYQPHEKNIFRQEEVVAESLQIALKMIVKWKNEGSIQINEYSNLEYALTKDERDRNMFCNRAANTFLSQTTYKKEDVSIWVEGTLKVAIARMRMLPRFCPLFPM